MSTTYSVTRSTHNGVFKARPIGRKEISGVPFDVYSVKATHVDLDALGRAKYRVRRMPTTFYLQINCLFV